MFKKTRSGDEEKLQIISTQGNLEEKPKPNLGQLIDNV
jgi:hypothetical protein